MNISFPKNDENRRFSKILNFDISYTKNEREIQKKGFDSLLTYLLSVNTENFRVIAWKMHAVDHTAESMFFGGVLGGAGEGGGGGVDDLRKLLLKYCSFITEKMKKILP